MASKFKSGKGVGIITAAAALFMVSAANANPIVATLEDSTNGGGFFAEVRLENAGADTVKVTADIADPINQGLTEGDILGLWLDIGNEALLAGLTFSNETPANIISTSIVDANNVNVVGPDANSLNGTGESGFDIGLAFSAPGCGDGCFQTIMFNMNSAGLTSAVFDGQRIGMRVASISGDDPFVYSAGSSKLIGEGENGGGPSEIPAPGTILLLAAGLFGLRFRLQS